MARAHMREIRRRGAFVAEDVAGNSAQHANLL
jgi:hypothetical protein